MVINFTKSLRNAQWFILLVPGILTYFIGGDIWASLAFAILGAIGAVGLLSRLTKLPAFIYALIFLDGSFLLLSSFGNETSPMALLTASKYLVMMPLLAASLLAPRINKNIQWPHVFNAWPSILVVQIAVLAYQYKVIYPQSGSWDSMTGTFGGDPFGGGNSAGLAFFLIVYCANIISRFVEREITIARALFWLVLIFIASLLAEIKVVVAITPLLFWMCTAIDGRKIIRSFIYLAIGLLTASVLLYLYFRIYYSSFLTNFSDIWEYLAPELSDFSYVNKMTGEFGRVSGLWWWWTFNSDDLDKVFLGHGLLTTKETTALGVGALELTKYYKLGNTTVTALLWEVGVVGCGLFLLPPIYGMISGIKNLRKCVDKEDRIVYRTATVGLFVYLLICLYSRTAYETPQSQFILLTLMCAAIRRTSRQSLGRSNRFVPLARSARGIA